MVRSNVKKILWISLPVLAVLTALAIGGAFLSSADQLEDFQINGNVLTGYSGSSDTVTVPDSVTVIGANAFADNQVVKEVTIPDGVREIRQGAFSGCTSLEAIDIPDSVTVIEGSAFDGCGQLREVSIGNGLSTLGDGAFSSCDSLRTITISPENTSFVCKDNILTNAGETVLYQYLAGATAASYKMPDTIQEIRKYAFWGEDDLTYLDLSAGLSKVDNYAVADCSGLKTVILHEPLQTIGMGAFADDSSLTEIVMPVSVTNIHDSAFTAASSDMLIVCPSGSYAEKYAEENGYLADVSGTVPEAPAAEAAASEETVLAVSVNGAVSGNGASDGSDAGIQDGSESASGLSGILQDISDTVSQVQGDELGNGVIVSDRVFVMMDSPDVKDGAEVAETALDSLLQNGVLSDFAYYKDSSISDFSTASALGDIREIGRLSFARSGIASAQIPEGVTSIGFGAFYHADSLTDVSIPSTVTYVGANAFAYTPWYESWLQNSSDDYLVVGDGVLVAYKGADLIPEIPEGVKYISPYAFQDNLTMEDVVLPGSLLQIEEHAFSGCKALKQINHKSWDENPEIQSISKETSFEDCPVAEQL